MHGILDQMSLFDYSYFPANAMNVHENVLLPAEETKGRVLMFSSSFD